LWHDNRLGKSKLLYSRTGSGGPPFGAIRLAELVGGPRAKEIMMPCKRISASEAASIGLVNRVVADEELMSSAISLAEDIGKKGPIAIQMIKVSMNRG
jgi:enoyl-CoA hydratase/carnithine racemase